MEIYLKIYDMAASAGALEGYVYPKEKVDTHALGDWIQNLVKQYFELPIEARNCFQSSLDRTAGRSIQALIPLLGPDHSHILDLKKLVVGKIPESYDDFEKEKEEKSKYKP